MKTFAEMLEDYLPPAPVKKSEPPKHDDFMERLDNLCHEHGGFTASMFRELDGELNR